LYYEAYPSLNEKQREIEEKKLREGRKKAERSKEKKAEHD
jgi:hypothetical protein